MNKIEIIRVPDSEMQSCPQDQILEKIGYKKGDMIDRVYFDEATKEHVIRIIRGADE